MHKQWSPFLWKFLNSPRSYDFLKQIQLDDTVDNMKSFRNYLSRAWQMRLSRSASFCWEILQPLQQEKVLFGSSNVKNIWNISPFYYKQSQGEDGQTFEVNETCENWLCCASLHACACFVHFLLLTPFSFVKLLKKDWWVVTKRG